MKNEIEKAFPDPFARFLSLLGNAGRDLESIYEELPRPNPRRGKDHVAIALEFLQQFPIGTRFLTQQFLEFLVQQGKLTNAEPSLQNLRTMYNWKDKINKALSSQMESDAAVIINENHGHWMTERRERLHLVKPPITRARQRLESLIEEITVTVHSMMGDTSIPKQAVDFARFYRQELVILSADFERSSQSTMRVLQFVTRFALDSLEQR